MLVESLKAYYTVSASHVKDVCLSIAYLCRFNLTNKISLATCGACKIIHECFILYISNESVIPSVMYAIVALSHQNKYNLQQFSALGVTDFILELYIGSDLVSHKNEPMIAMILWFIGHIPPTSVEMFSSPEVCKFTLSNIYMRSNPTTVAYGCKAVSALALCPSKQNHKLLVEMQVIEILQELSVVSFCHHTEVLTNSLMALASLVDGVSIFQNRVSVSAIVSVMEENYINRPVIAAALTALLSVFSGLTISKCDESHKKILTSPVTVKIILDCIRHHVTSERVGLLGCRLITLLCQNFKNIHKEFMEFGVCNFIMDVFKVHKRSVEVLQEVAGSAVVVCRLNFTCVSALCELGLVSTISSLLRNFISKETLVCCACEVIAIVAQQQYSKLSSITISISNSNSHSQIVQDYVMAGFPLVVVEVLQMYAAGARTGIEVPCQVPCQDSITDSMSGNAVPPATQHKLPSEQHLKILECAIDIVGNMGGMDAQLCAELEKAGVCECVLLLLIKNDKHVQVLRATLQALQQLGKQPNTRQHLLDIGIMGYIDQAAGSDSKSIPDESLVKVAKKTKTTLLGQSFLQRNIGIPF
jgi:hypothetical protein